MARYFNFFLILVVATILYSCSDNSNDPAEVQMKEDKGTTVEMTLKGKIEFWDGTVYESWDKPRIFNLPEKYSKNLLQKITEIVPGEPISRDYYYNIFQGYYSKVIIYSGSVVTFSRTAGYTDDKYDCLRNPRIRSTVTFYKGTAGANFYCGIRGQDQIYYYGTDYRTNIPLVSNTYTTITGEFYPFYSYWWCGGSYDKLELLVTIDYSGTPYDINKKVEVAEINYHLRADALHL